MVDQDELRAATKAALLKKLEAYVDADDVTLSKDDFLQLVAHRILEDLDDCPSDDPPDEYEGDGIHHPLPDGTFFADPGGDSALRAETPTNPRNLPCPTCGTPNMLTPADRAQGYQCNPCAERAERGGY